MHILSLVLLSFVFICVRPRSNSESDEFAFLPLAKDGEVDFKGRKSLFWMHIQKTSSWIGNLLLVWACPDACIQNLRYRNINDVKTLANLISSDPDAISPYDYARHLDIELEHWRSHKDSPWAVISGEDWVRRSIMMNCSIVFQSYNKGFGRHNPFFSPRMNGSVVSLFRKPSSRIISAYLFNVMFPDGSIYAPSRLHSGSHGLKAQLKNSPNGIFEYASIPGLSSCQTKMILGMECGADVSLSNNDTEEAIRRLRNEFYFIGLTEESEASANLFLAMHHADGASPNKKSLRELDNPPFNFTLKRTNEIHDPTRHSALLDILKKNNWNDPFDDAVYKEACELFYDRCKKYNIKTKFSSIQELMNNPH